MRLLAFETATEACSVAVYVDGAVHERFEIAPRRHAATLSSGRVHRAVHAVVRLDQPAAQLELPIDPPLELDPPVGALVETQDLDPPDEHVLHDEVQPAADQFIGALARSQLQAR